MDEVINVGMNKINKTPEAVKATANSSLKGNKKSMFLIMQRRRTKSPS